jgi:hypothetical protein
MMAPWWVGGEAIYALFNIKAKRKQHHFFVLFEHSWHSALRLPVVTQTAASW